MTDSLQLIARKHEDVDDLAVHVVHHQPFVRLTRRDHVHHPVHGVTAELLPQLEHHDLLLPSAVAGVAWPVQLERGVEHVSLHCPDIVIILRYLHGFVLEGTSTSVAVGGVC